MHIIDVKCANCTFWDSKDGLKGFCPEATERAMFLLDMPAGTLLTVETQAAGHCQAFEASEDALDEARAEAAHVAELERGAGTDYPASL